jgi:HK97 family phage portal protein
MGFLSSLVATNGGESKASSSAATLELFKQVFGSNTAGTGDAITWQRALQVSTVLACARVIADGIAQVPFKLFRETPDGAPGGPAKDHRHYRLLNLKPNPWQTSFEWRETMALHIVLMKGHFSFINRVGGRIVELIPLEPQRMKVERLKDWSLKYTYCPENGPSQEFPPETIFHVPSPSWNGWEGLEALQLAREVIGLALATERAHVNLHKNGVSPSGTWSIKDKLPPDQYGQLKSYLMQHAGENSGLPMIIDRGAQWVSQRMSGVDAQHIETRKHQVEEICRTLKVFPIMVGHADKTATFASSEAFFDAHVKHTLAPHYRRIEERVMTQILTERDLNDGIYAKFVVNALLRGSMKDRSEFYAKALGAGGSPAWMAQDEVRALEDMNPMGGTAAKLPVPTNVGGTAPAPTEGDDE